MVLLLQVVHQLVHFVSKLLYRQSTFLVAVLGSEQRSLKCRSDLLLVKLRFLSRHLHLVFAALLCLRQVKLGFVSSKHSFLQLLLQLSYLARVVLLFEVELLLKLVDFDLEFDPAFAFKIVGFEQLQLKRITLLAHSISFFTQLAFKLLRLQVLHFEFTDLLFQQRDAFVQKRFSALCVMRLLGELLSVSVFDVLLEFLD